MKYISTRGAAAHGVSSAYAIKNGIAEDGGLYMPESIPSISLEEIDALANKGYTERAAYILSKFLTDYTEAELSEDAENAYSKVKFGLSPAPIKKINSNITMLELWHGPTSAFKDMALQIMPRLFVRALRKCQETRTALILVATSGDTGKAALEGYKNIDGTKIKVFYPENGVSTVQKLQMQSQDGSNVSIDGIDGNFDDAQNGVKNIFSNTDFKEKLNSQNVFLSSANSINWGRLVPQIVYYISAYTDMYKTAEINLGDKIDVCVPTGNFGNIFAAYIAKKMGLPIEKLICASNQNDVLTEFFESGRYNKKRELKTSISPSMDILISSNLERLLYTEFGVQKNAEYMAKLAADGEYTLSNTELETIRNTFVGYSASEEDTREAIKYFYEKENCLTDTHTAVALSAIMRYMNEYKAERKILAVSTASPFKFASDVLFALRKTKPADEISALNELASLTDTEIPYPLRDMENRKIIHDSKIKKEDMENSTFEFAKA